MYVCKYVRVLGKMYVTQQRCAARRRRAACRALAAVWTTIERCLLQPDVVSGARLRFGRLARKAKIWRVPPSAGQEESEKRAGAPRGHAALGAVPERGCTKTLRA